MNHAEQTSQFAARTIPATTVRDVTWDHDTTWNRRPFWITITPEGSFELAQCQAEASGAPISWRLTEAAS